MKKEELQAIITNPNIDSDIKKDAQEQLDKLARLEAEDETQGVDSDIIFAVKEFNKSIEKLANAGVDKTKVEEIVTDRFKSLKVGKKNLDSSILELIGKTQSVQIVNWQNVAVKTQGKQRKIFDIILSDFEAGNNVYLYGGAGTGKTYIAGQISKALNYKLVTLNCNQFTSPLDIVGGQTIDGYQEGRLTYAFGNLWNVNEVNEKTGKPYSGALLLLDELPKLDPNTAGVLNDGLSKIKDPIELSEKSGREIMPTITNGRGEVISKKNIFVIATGNSLLNEADVNYEANFKQDLSLQDRFAGSTYELIIDPQYELDTIMSNIKVGDEIASFVFIFNFLFKLRTAIEKNNYSGRAFVSQRLMVSMRDTYIAYRLNELQGAKKISSPKTLQLAVKTFLDLFTEQQRSVLDTDVNTKEFYDLVIEKNKLPMSDLVSDVDKKEAEMLIKQFEQNTKDKIK